MSAKKEKPGKKKKSAKNAFDVLKKEVKKLITCQQCLKLVNRTLGVHPAHTIFFKICDFVCAYNNFMRIQNVYFYCIGHIPHTLENW